MAKGGNGALVTSSSIAVSAGTKYTIVVGAGGGYSSYSGGDYGRGAAGGTSTAFGLSAAGGAGATGSNGANAGNGSGGAGGSSGNGSPGWVSFSYSITGPQYCKITLGTS
ncbi:MAG: hypothetical protein IKB96_03065 [Prevotella sp.]|nr:hypothetical protein [Prevotella sp.]